MSDCLFCKIIAGQIPAAVTYRDEHVLAFKDIQPRAPMHELVIPLRHIATVAEATPADAELLGRMMLVAAKRAGELGYGAGGYRLVMNHGKDAGQTVFHAHLHILAGRPLDWPPG